MSEVESLIQFLSEDAQVEKNSVEDTIKRLEQLSTSQGLGPDSIAALMQVILGDSVGNVLTRSRLVRCLVPSRDVPHAAVLAALGGMGQIPSSLRLLLFKWIVLVYDLIDNKAPLHYVYDIIFHYVQYDGLRQIVCQLLCYLTTREDVKKYRVQRLLQMSGRVLLIQQDSADSALVALLSIYKLLCPHLVSLPVPFRMKVWFRPVEKHLARNIARVQGQRSNSGATRLEKVQQCLECIPPPAKRAKHDTVFGSSDIVAPPSSGLVSANSLTSVDDLCQNIHRLEPPQQAASMFDSPLLQHVFSVWSDRSLSLRFISWLQHALGYELDMYVPGAQESPFLSNLLKCLVKLTTFLSEPVPTVEHFLSILLETWNGEDYQSEVLSLLSHLSLQPFEDLEECYLAPLKKLFVAKDVHFQYLTVSALTRLLGNLAAFEWPRMEQRRREEEDLLTQHYSVFPWDEDIPLDFDPARTLQLFIRYVEDILCCVTVETKPHPLLQHATTSFYELVTQLPTEAAGCVPILCIPRPHLVFSALLSLDTAAISRHMACFVRCKETLSGLKRSERSGEQISTFNSLVLDLCDSLWRNLAFANTKRPYPSLLFTLTSEVLDDNGLHDNHNKLSVTHHPAFLGHIFGFIREKHLEEETEEGEKGELELSQPPVRVDPDTVSIQPKLRAKFLDHLQEMKLHGLVDFIRTFLRQRQDSTEE